jgi:hypothetical protein
MALNFDKPLEPLVIESDEPEELDVEVMLDEDEDETEDGEETPAAALAFDDNLVGSLSDADKNAISTDLWAAIQTDKNSRTDWELLLKEGIKLLGLKYEKRMEPWEDACGVYSSVLTEAVVRFQSETIMETFPASGPVKTVIIGQQTPEKVQAAQRVKEDMNYQLTEVMPEFRAEHERMLFNLGFAGCSFKKVYVDPALNRQVSMYCPAEDVILPYGASVITTAERITHRMRKTEFDVKVAYESGFYAGTMPESPSVIADNEVQQAKDEEAGVVEQEAGLYTFYETSTRYAIKGLGDEIPKPYVITFDEFGEVVAVRRNWLDGDTLALPRQHFIKYDYIPGFGPYGFGLVHVIGGLARGITTIDRILVDAGELSSLQGGFKTSGMRVKNGNQTVGPNEWVDVDVPSGTLRDNIVPLPFKEPSATLAQLRGALQEDARRLASTADMDVSDMSAQAPVGTTMALLERLLKVMSAVQARVHFSFKQELRLLASIIRDYAPDEYDYDPDNAPRTARKTDYEYVEIIPVSDPNAATMSQRIVLYQAVMMLAEKAPGLYNQHELHSQMLEALGVKNIPKLLPSAPEQPPMDPVTEGMNIINGKPAKAFLHQDHNAHLMVHNNMVQDPLMQQQIGQSPNAQAIMGALLAHINEHLAFQYRQQLEQNLGVPLPPPDKPLPPEIEVQLAPLIAQASKMLLAQNQIASQAQKAEQMANDPMLALQKEELQLKRDKLEAEKVDSLRDFKTAQDTLKVKREQMLVDLKKHGVTLGVDLLKEKMKQGSADKDRRTNASLKLVDIGARGKMGQEKTTNKPKPKGDK